MCCTNNLPWIANVHTNTLDQGDLMRSSHPQRPQTLEIFHTSGKGPSMPSSPNQISHLASFITLTVCSISQLVDLITFVDFLLSQSAALISFIDYTLLQLAALITLIALQMKVNEGSTFIGPLRHPRCERSKHDTVNEVFTITHSMYMHINLHISNYIL